MGGLQGARVGQIGVCTVTRRKTMLRQSWMEEAGNLLDGKGLQKGLATQRFPNRVFQDRLS
ncbi:MAG: hypothetical protein CMM01_03555 [Rhodopirellula sp.]|nr:hypothetical protein [Rhodopirellula sp.]